MAATSLPTPAPAWRLQDAKAQFSALVDSALRGVPQHVTRSGKPAVVVLSEQDFERLQRSAASQVERPCSLVQHLLSMPKENQSAGADSADSTVGAVGLEIEPRELDWS